MSEEYFIDLVRSNLIFFKIFSDFSSFDLFLDSTSFNLIQILNGFSILFLVYFHFIL